MEITPKAMEIECIRIKRLNLEKEKAYAIGWWWAGMHFIPSAGSYSFKNLCPLDFMVAERLN